MFKLIELRTEFRKRGCPGYLISGRNAHCTIRAINDHIAKYTLYTIIVDLVIFACLKFREFVIL